MTRLESRKSTTALFDARFQKSFTNVASALNAMTAVQWTRKCCEQLVVEELLRGTSVETISVELTDLEQLFQNALMLKPPPVDVALTAEGEHGEKGTHPDGKNDQPRGGAAERKAVYAELLQALLVRVQEQHSESESFAPVEALQALLLASQAAAA